MDIRTAIDSRRAIRDFQDKPVDPEVIRQVLELAVRAPSGGNLQPWHFHIVSGESMTRLKALMRERVSAAPTGEETEPGLQGVVQRVWRRQDDHGAAGPTHPPLPHRRDRQSELALQALDGTTGRNQVHPQQNTQRSRPDSRLIHNRAVRFFVNLVAQFWT